MSEARICWEMAEGWASFSLNTDSITDSSVLVVSWPVKAHQSLTTIPAPITSVPRLTVPATNGIWGDWLVMHQHLRSDLEKGAQLFQVGDRGFGRKETTIVGKGTVTSHLLQFQLEYPMLQYDDSLPGHCRQQSAWKPPPSTHLPISLQSPCTKSIFFYKNLIRIST